VIPTGIPGTMPELVAGEVGEMQPGHPCRGPMRTIAWTRVTAGTAKFLGQDPALAQGDLPIPLVGGSGSRPENRGASCSRMRACPRHPISGRPSTGSILRSSQSSRWAL
jgi:hypothetical protein